jgi:short subunit dehydrogenase-like uncharacterized protein
LLLATNSLALYARIMAIEGRRAALLGDILTTSSTALIAVIPMVVDWFYTAPVWRAGCVLVEAILVGIVSRQVRHGPSKKILGLSSKRGYVSMQLTVA